jgi:hypothetical protein
MKSRVANCILIAAIAAILWICFGDVLCQTSKSWLAGS